MNKLFSFFVLIGIITLLQSCGSIKIAYSTIYVPEEGGINFVKLTIGY